MAGIKPLFEHGCANCTYLGPYSGPGQLHGSLSYDLYFCPQGRVPTVIARYGSGGSYKSGLGFEGLDDSHPLREAERRARLLKLL